MSSKKQQVESATNPTAHNKATWGSNTMYSVYIHHKRNEDIENLICWERRESTKNREKALGQARSLYQLYDCDKIEVKKTYHSTKQGKMVNKTIKTYSDNSMESLSKPIKAALAIIAITLCAAISTYLFK